MDGKTKEERAEWVALLQTFLRMDDCISKKIGKMFGCRQYALGGK
jgi:hypothetical protein